MANGIYDYAQSSPVTAGSSPTTLLTRNIASGGVADGNCMVLRCEFSGSGTASLMLNGVNLLVDPWPISGSDQVVEVEVWRVGRYEAMARVWNGYGGGNQALVPGGRFPVTGLDWQSGQTLAVVGQGSGLTLSRAGLAK